MHGQLQQAAIDSNNNATSYIEDFLDCVENLPDDLQRNISHMRELDVEYQEILHKLETDQKTLNRDLDATSRKRCLSSMQQRLIQSQEIGDKKLEVAQQILDLIENKSRQLEVDFKNMGTKSSSGKDQENSEPGRTEAQQPERSSKRARRQRNDATPTTSVPEATPERAEERPTATATVKKTKKKKRRSKAMEKDRDYSPVEQPVDPDEPTYCLCQQISYGEMIGCDNERCSIEWFHFSCVGLTTKPKGKWFCPKCRGDRPNVQKPRT